ncbi:MAG TPA: acyltransferase family protein [Anaeromyxobacter sp.]|nr:acyltransferase family protein [Anaeromyxobacter sp.]
MDAPRTDRLASLTGLRFAAALGILLFHYGEPLVRAAPAALERIRAGGYVWVGLFYLLSGFVLARAHPAPMGRDARRAFWIARLARLYPAYLLAFALSAPFALERWAGHGTAGAAKAAAVAAAALLLVQAWIPPVARLWNTPGWSTSVVLAFYAAFPFAAARLARLSRRGLLAALGGAWLLSLAFPLAWLALRPDGPVADLTWEEPFWLEALKFHPLARAGEFLAGVALGLLERRGQLRAPPWAAAPAALAALAVLAWGGAQYVLLHNGALVPLFAIVLLGLARARGAAARVLGSAPARALGDASFALYALQEPLWLWSRRLLAPDAAAPPSPAFALAFAAGAVAVSVAVSALVERPARRALRAALAPRGAGAGLLARLAPGEREGA